MPNPYDFSLHQRRNNNRGQAEKTKRKQKVAKKYKVDKNFSHREFDEQFMGAE